MAMRKPVSVCFQIDLSIFRICPEIPLTALIPCLRALSLVLRQSRILQRWRAPFGLVLLRQKGGIWPLGRSAHCPAPFRPAQ